MNDIKLVSEEYTSKFVTGPELTQELSQKQDTLQWYNESGSGSMDPYKVDIASNIVTLRSGDDTVGMISEDTKLELNSGIHISTTVGGSWRNILSSDIEDNVILGDPDNYIYCQCELYDKDGNEITGGSSAGGSKWVTDGTDGGKTYLSLGRDENTDLVNSIFVCGPMYHNYYAAGIEFTGTWEKGGIKMNTNDGGIFMNVGGPGGGEITGVIIEHSNSYRLTLSPFLCTYYNGPCVGHDIEYNNLALVGGEGGSVKIVARDSSGNEKYAYINYDNIDKLINLLNS